MTVGEGVGTRLGCARHLVKQHVVLGVRDGHEGHLAVVRFGVLDHQGVANGRLSSWKASEWLGMRGGVC